ncbi:hypothetical protein N0V90_004929 [Kalmusia sp. IMI 367209]|nr:hypothetical protein N0V90_004929 [Kalmusia sp. IMI 367209]
MVQIVWHKAEEGPRKIMDGNVVLGTEVVEIVISKLKKAPSFIDDLLSQPDTLSRIRKIELRGEHDEDEDEEQEQEDVIVAKANIDTAPDVDIDSNRNAAKDDSTDAEQEPQWKRDRAAEEKIANARTARLCEPITRLLSALSSTSTCNLQVFTWLEVDEDLPGTRPVSYWEALYAHAPTLRVLKIDYTTHEVHHLPTLAPSTPFSSLRELHLDASGGHGDNGTAIDALLKASPNIETLVFRWPVCDLDTCQIQNITWDYEFRNLKRLDVAGYDFAPVAFKAFLERCGGVEVLSDKAETVFYTDSDDGVETGVNSKGGEEEKCALEPSMFPHLTTLRVSSESDCRSLGMWFDPIVNRPIRHLRLSGFAMKHQLDELMNVDSRMLANLKVLELDGVVTLWRKERTDSDSDSDDDDDDKDGKDNNKNDINIDIDDDDSNEKGHERHQQEEKLSDTAKALQTILPHLSSLQELSIELDSARVSIYYTDKPSEHPPAMSFEDLKLFLDILPKNTRLRALRLRDSSVGLLPQAELDKLANVPDSLEYLSWEGEQRALYKFHGQSEEAKVKLCEAAGEKVKGDWAEETILEL